MVLLMDLQVFRQFIDPRGEDRYLNLRGTCIGIINFVIIDNRTFLLFRQHRLKNTFQLILNKLLFFCKHYTYNPYRSYELTGNYIGRYRFCNVFFNFAKSLQNKSKKHISLAKTTTYEILKYNFPPYWSSFCIIN